MVDQTPKPVWFKSWLWTGCSFLGAVGVGLLLLTELRSGAVLAALGGLGAYFLLAFLLPQSLSGAGRVVQEPVLALTPDADPRVELLVEAHQHAATLAATAKEVPLDVGQSVSALSKQAHAIIEKVSESPEKLSPVLRFFTYYLPSAADLATDRVKLASHAGSARLLEIDQTLARLVEAFAGFEATLMSPDLKSVDLDIELLEDAIKADFENLKS
jgi:hypothetical protein